MRFKQISQRRISINTMVKNTKTNWGLISTTLVLEIITLPLEDG
jgi:hypothetical protein